MLPLPAVMWNVDPVLWRGEVTTIRYYGVVLIAELALAYLLLLWQLRRARADDEEAGDFANYLYPAAYIGGRLGHVLFYDFERLAHDPLWVFQLWRGGMSGHGALLGVFVATYLFTKRRALPWTEGTDRIVFSVALCAVLHRLGNLMNSELVGTPTGASWGFFFPRYDLPSAPLLRHPVQLYEAICAAFVLGLLVICDRLWSKSQRPRGALTGILLIALFSGRTVLEFWRQADESDPVLPLLTMGQLLSIPCVAAGLVLLWLSLKRRQASGWVVGG